MMALFDFLVITVLVWGVVRITSKWLKTKEGITQRRLQALEQRIQVLETQQVQDVQKRLSVLEEIFVTEDVDLQRKLRHTLGGNSFGTPPPPPSSRPLEHL